MIIMKVSQLIEALRNFESDEEITFYFLKDNILTNCQLESTCWYPDMGVEFTVQDTSEILEEAN